MAKAKLKKRTRELAEEVKQAEGTEQNSFDAFIAQNKNLLIGGAAIVLVAILGALGYNYWNTQQNQEASESMFQAVKYFEADSFNLALNGDAEGNPGLLDIIDEYGSTDAANMARYYAGIIHVKQGELESGVEYLKDVSLPSGSMLALSTNVALGFAHEDLGDPAKAADYFEDAADAVGANEFTTPTMLMHAGRNYEAAGQPDKALRVYQRIKDDYPQSSEGRQIQKYIGRVKG